MMTANTGKNKGKKIMPKGKPWQKGVSGNPKGRPKTGASWGEIAKEIGEQYPEEVTKIFGDNTVMGRAYASFPKGVQIKYNVLYRVIVSLMNDPTTGLLKEFWERIDGKVNQSVDVTTGGEKITDIGLKIIDYRTGVAEIENGSSANSESSSKD